jgi:hypothetical protein
MSSAKKTKIKDLWEKLSKNTDISEHYKIRNGIKINIGFVNQFALHKKIPNKWFDWENRINAKIMIIGQDWGPYSALLPYIEGFNKESINKNFDYDNFLFKTFSSRTEKFILQSIERSFEEEFNKKISKDVWREFVFTVAVLFTRQGNHFRGNEFYDEKFGVEQSYPYLKKQIEIIQPKVIMPLGGTAWKMIGEIFNLDYPETITNVITVLRKKPIKINEQVIIPNFHPASHTDPKEQYQIWQTLWENIDL